MKYRITLGQLPLRTSNEGHLPALTEIHRKLVNLAGKYHPCLLSGVVEGSYGYPTYEMEVPSGDRDFEVVLAELRTVAHKTKIGIGGFITAFPTGGGNRKSAFSRALLLWG